MDPAFSAKYNKAYVGPARNGLATNFVPFAPKQQFVRVELRLERSDEVQSRLEQSGIDLMEYNARSQRYKFRLSSGDVEKNQIILEELFALSYDQFTS